MLFRNRFLLLLALAALLAFLSLSLQFFHLIPVSAARNGASSKSRKRIMPDPVTEPPVTDPVYEALLYCNIPSVAERSMEGHAPHHFKLVSVHALIRHGDRYPLYAIPKTKRPEIDCTLVANRKPYHPKLEAFVSHMSKGSGSSFESPLNSMPLYPNHALCEMGELTQTAGSRVLVLQSGTSENLCVATSLCGGIKGTTTMHWSLVLSASWVLSLDEGGSLS